MKLKYIPKELRSDEPIATLNEKELLKPTAETPTLTSMGIYKGEKGWVYFILETKGNKIVSYKESQDDLRVSVIDKFKLEAQRLFMED